MINLSVSDPIDGKDKIGELRGSIGKDYCGNNKLLSVSKDGNRCIVLRNVWDYTGANGKLSIVRTKKVSEPSWLTWNRMFY